VIQPNRDDPAFRRFNAAVTFVIAATVAGIAYWYEHDRRSWWTQNRPIAPLVRGFNTTGRRVRRFGSNARDLNESLSAVGSAARPHRDAEGAIRPPAPGGAPQMRSGVAGAGLSMRSKEEIRRAARIRAAQDRLAKRRARRGLVTPHTPPGAEGGRA
jgi:hypothetical protein